MAAIAGRVIVKTDTPGWFSDPATDKKVRKQEGDRVVTQAEYDQMLLDAEGGGSAEAAGLVTAPRTLPDQPTTSAPRAGQNAQHREQAAKAAAPTVTLTSGARTTGATVTIKCAWVDPDKRTAKQAKLFEKFAAGDRAALTYDKVLSAAGDDEAALPDGRERVIKRQDAFQVRFHSDNQPKWRAELRRAKTRARREAARKAAKA